MPDVFLPLPRRPAITWGRFTRFIIVLAVIAPAFFLVQPYEVGMMRLPGEVMPPKEGGFLEQVIIGFKNFAQILTIIIVTIIVASYDSRRKWIIAAVWLAQTLAMVSYNIPKRTIARLRPFAAAEASGEMAKVNIAETWKGWQPGETEFNTRSFPSGHSAAAFALAGVLSPFYRRLRWALWILAVGTAVTRYLNEVHWPSDCLAGATLGYVCAWIALWICLPRAPRS